jgi:hypothetical protein
LVQVNAERRDEEPAAPAARGDDAGFAGPFTLDPRSEECGRGTEQDEKQRVHPAKRADLPVIGSRMRDADGVAEREPEHAEAVGHADREVNGQRRGRDEPPVEVGRRDDPFLVEETRHQAVNVGVRVWRARVRL